MLSEKKYTTTAEEKQKPGTTEKDAVLMQDDGGSSLEKLVVRKSRAVAGPVRCSTLELDSQESHKTSEQKPPNEDLNFEGIHDTSQSRGTICAPPQRAEQNKEEAQVGATTPERNKGEVPASISGFAGKSPLIQVYKDGRYNPISPVQLINAAGAKKKAFKVPQNAITKTTRKHGLLPTVPASVSTVHLTRGGGEASPSLFHETKSRQSSLQRKRNTRLYTDEGQRSEASSEAPTPSEWQL